MKTLQPRQTLTVRRSDRRLIARWEKIEEQMIANAQLLARQGSIASRRAHGRRLWLLRFMDVDQGRCVQRALYLGGDDQVEVVQRARDLLALLQAPKHLIKELKLVRSLIRKLCTIMRRARPGLG